MSERNPVHRKPLAMLLALCMAVLLSVAVDLATASSAQALSLSKSELTIHYSKSAKVTLRGVGAESDVSWSTSNGRVAKVSKVGGFSAKIEGLAHGTATVKAKVGSEVVSCTVKVPRFKVVGETATHCKATQQVKCSHCGKTYSVSKGTHRWKTMKKKAATYFTSGYVKSKCKRCKKTRTVVKKKAPPAPLSASYAIEDPASGLADGTVTVSVPQSIARFKTDIVMYWGTQSGFLSGYTNLAKAHVRGEETTFELAKGSVIPKGATRLYVFTRTNGCRSASGIAIDLPEDRASVSTGKLLASFQVISDLHVNTNKKDKLRKRGAKNFAKALRDINRLSPNSFTVVVGDITDRGRSEEYDKAAAVIARQKGVSRSSVYYTMGNHDTFKVTKGPETTKAKRRALQRLFKRNAKKAKGVSFGGSAPSDVYYAFKRAGLHHIVLGNEDARKKSEAVLSKAQLTWFERQLAAAQGDTGNKPIFVYLHQSLYNTVAGSLPGQRWDGVSSMHSNKNDGSSRARLKDILKKYPQVMLFDGHSHWTMNSRGNMHPRNLNGDGLPSIFNTSAIAYLNSSYDDPNDRKRSPFTGSQGYYVRVYENGTMVLGRDFLSRSYLPSACYFVEDAELQASEPDDGGSDDQEVVVDGTPTDEMPGGTESVEEEPTIGEPDEDDGGQV